MSAKALGPKACARISAERAVCGSRGRSRPSARGSRREGSVSEAVVGDKAGGLIGGFAKRRQRLDHLLAERIDEPVPFDIGGRCVIGSQDGHLYPASAQAQGGLGEGPEVSEPVADHGIDRPVWSSSQKEPQTGLHEGEDR